MIGGWATGRGDPSYPFTTILLPLLPRVILGTLTTLLRTPIPQVALAPKSPDALLVR